MNYYSILCFFWAFIALLCRFFIYRKSAEWKEWELQKAYPTTKPVWVNFVAVFGILLVIFTWYHVLTYSVANSWIIAVLITITLFKAFKLLFKYSQFREFVVRTLNDTKRWKLINILVTCFAIGLILMGIFLY